jgi:hypothetical protein
MAMKVGCGATGVSGTKLGKLTESESFGALDCGSEMCADFCLPVLSAVGSIFFLLNV